MGNEGLLASTRLHLRGVAKQKSLVKGGHGVRLLIERVIILRCGDVLLALVHLEYLVVVLDNHKLVVVVFHNSGFFGPIQHLLFQLLVKIILWCVLQVHLQLSQSRCGG